MNEFQKSQEDEDFKALREAVPAWKSQPIAQRDSLANDVQSPTWNKIGRMGVDPSSLTTGGGTPQAGTARVICALQSGSTFIPKIMRPVEGTTFEDP